MSEDIVLMEVDGRGVARVTLNRPEIHNALDERVIARMTEITSELDGRDDVRVVILTGNGKSFCAGGDLNWMKRTANYSMEENRADADKLGKMLQRLNLLSKPVVGLIQGPAYGGGVGMVASCDIAIASEKARFTLSEVMLGLMPATISPYVVRAIGPRQARRYFVTAEIFDAATARELGLVHEVVPADALEARGAEMVAQLLQCGPRAQAESKDLIYAVMDRPIDDGMVADTARRIAEIRATPEGQEGVAAFLEKRVPAFKVER